MIGLLMELIYLVEDTKDLDMGETEVLMVSIVMVRQKELVKD
jgi:hypothetical protein